MTTRTFTTGDRVRIVAFPTFTNIGKVGTPNRRLMVGDAGEVQVPADQDGDILVSWDRLRGAGEGELSYVAASACIFEDPADADSRVPGASAKAAFDELGEALAGLLALALLAGLADAAQGAQEGGK